MSKSRKQGEREKRRPPTALPKKPRRMFLIIGKLFAAVLVFCSLLALLVFWPRVVVESDSPFDPASPHPIAFKITNTGFVALRDIQPALGICALWFGEPKNLPDRCAGSLGDRFAMPQWRANWLNRDETLKIRLDDLIQPERGGK